MSGGLGAAVATAAALFVGATLGSVMLLGDAQQAAAGPCGPSGPAVQVDLAGIPAGPVAGYAGPQLVNAALVMDAARGLGLDLRAQTVGVMTAMGESSLTVLDYGDRVGPDSRGLFQQRANGAWGSYQDRMDPTVSARNFYRAAAAVPGWAALPPTLAAHAVQRNADPYYYEPFWDRAVAVVAALTGPVQLAAVAADIPGLGPVTTSPAALASAGVAPGTGALSCTGASPSLITAGGWTRPALGPVTSSYGPRVHPVTGVSRLHAGTDIGGGCDNPIYAAAAGVVVKAGPAGGYGNLITVDHGGGVTTRYAHMYNNGVLVQVGQNVTAGQQIARVGSSGASTGCHLHFEVRLGDDFVNPAAFLTERGAALS